MINLYTTLHLTAIKIQYLIAIEMQQAEQKKLRNVQCSGLTLISYQKDVCIYIYVLQ